MLNLTILSATDKAEAAKTGNNIYDPKIQEIVKRVLKNIIKSQGIPSHMRDDAAIDIYMELHRAASKFNPEKCDFINYSRMVINRHAAFIVRKYKKRNRLTTTSLYAPIDDKGHTLADMLEAEAPSEETTEKHVEKVLQLMPEELRNICYEIMKEKSIRNLAKKHRMSFSWFYKKYLIPIRQSYITCEKKLCELEADDETK